MSSRIRHCVLIYMSYLGLNSSYFYHSSDAEDEIEAARQVGLSNYIIYVLTNSSTTGKLIFESGHYLSCTLLSRIKAPALTSRNLNFLHFQV